jgi:hypothetical protein
VPASAFPNHTQERDMPARKILGSMLLAMAALLLGGCATLPSTEQMKAAVATYQVPRLPDPGTAMVYVVRPSALGTLVRFNVFLNNQEEQSEVGFTRGNQYIYFTVPPGSHKIYSKAENWAEAALELRPGEVVFLQQEPTMGLIMARNNLFRLEEFQGKYHVKNLEMGTLLKGKLP